MAICPEYHASQVADAVIITRHLQGTLVLPEYNRGDHENIKSEDIYDVDKFIKNLDGVVKVVRNGQFIAVDFTRAEGLS
ncbi:hypothetical protein Ddye_024470 [Dipteronia dyeriana]|uniref:O-fucosyltransferase family protein n=1 Tax=Dipteronia dyeriana TaxID=168575 RepID=A0AAD9WU99_9ROSI|nr:hypothetical protein Ddye_024470 [Dipteronia dyeriana]